MLKRETLTQLNVHCAFMPAVVVVVVIIVSLGVSVVVKLDLVLSPGPGRSFDADLDRVVLGVMIQLEVAEGFPLVEAP